MTVTHSSTSDRARQQREASNKKSFLLFNIVLSLLVTLLLAYGSWRVSQVQEQEYHFNEITTDLQNQKQANQKQTKSPSQICVLNQVTSSKELLPLLDFVKEEADRRFVASMIYGFITNRSLQNIGQLTRIRYSEKDLLPDVVEYRQRLDKAIKEAEDQAQKQQQQTKDIKDKSYINLIMKSLGLITVKNEDQILVEADVTAQLLRIENIQRIKAGAIVRTPSQYQSVYWKWIIIAMLSMFCVQVLWLVLEMRGDVWLVTTACALTSIGLLMSVSLRDPLRDKLEFVGFAHGILFGCIAIVALIPLARLNILHRLRKTNIWIWLGISFLLSITLLIFGKGPEGSPDVKVNIRLLGQDVQPVEFIKIGLVLFLSGYFARKWEYLRELNQKSVGIKWLRGKLPRIKDIAPVVIGVVVALLFFCFQRDLGPALILSVIFLMLYGVARNRFGLATFGLLTLIAAFWGSYHLGSPPTVVDRINMCASPFDNYVRGGEQVAHSLWAFATGGFWGTGFGYGDARAIPEGYTDLIIAVIGEQLGFIGIILVYGLYIALLISGVRIAMRATETYNFFLALGLTFLLVFEIILISGGILGLLPLSGVVSPFLSHGKTSMVANCLIIGLLLVLSSHTASDSNSTSFFKRPVILIMRLIGILFILFIGQVVRVQIVNADEIMLAGALVVRRETFSADEIAKFKEDLYQRELEQEKKRLDKLDDNDDDEKKTIDESFEDKFKEDFFRRYGTSLKGTPFARREYIYNPCISDIARLVPRGTIFDRNGIPLATSSWEELEKNRQTYSELGTPIDQVCVRTDKRHYPFRDILFHLLGDWKTRENWGASNTLFVERDSNDRLQGFKVGVQELSVFDTRLNTYVVVTKKDYRELLSVLRHRHEPEHSAMKEFLSRKRDLQMSIDIRFQKRVAAILKEHIKIEGTKAGFKRGAVVVLSPATGDLLASVSYPWPCEIKAINPPANVDEKKRTAILEENLKSQMAMLLDRARVGYFPPGSTFKLVTAISALPSEQDATFQCVPLQDGRVGCVIPGWSRPIRDDKGDSAHGMVDLKRGIIVSCNAYFAQLGVKVGPGQLFDTMKKFYIQASVPNTADELGKYLPQSAYGQGEVRATPFQMARVAATIANNGKMPFGRWVMDESNSRTEPVKEIISPQSAQIISHAMRGVVTEGTGKVLAREVITIVGKTGTAEVYKAKSHSWFIGFAPYQASPTTQIAFSVLIENGGYGGRQAAPVTAKVIVAARELNLIGR